MLRYTYIAVYSPVVTICTARFNIRKLYSLPTQCIYVFCVDLRTNSDYSYIRPLCYLQFSCLYVVSRFDVTPNDFKCSRFARSNLGE